MSYNVILLPAAEDDYQEILRYFEKQFDSQQAIRSFVKDFAASFGRDSYNLWVLPRRGASAERIQEVLDWKICGSLQN